MFTLENYETRDCTARTNTGAYSCLRVEFMFRREISPYIRRVYIPAYILVVISWIAFWLHPNRAQTLRIATQLVSLLGLFYLYSLTNVPRVSYTTSLDSFFIVSIISVIVSFVLNVIIASVSSGGEGGEQKGKISSVMARHADKLDLGARFILPVLYTVYTVIYLMALGHIADLDRNVHLEHQE